MNQISLELYKKTKMNAKNEKDQYISIVFFYIYIVSTFEMCTK